MSAGKTKNLKVHDDIFYLGTPLEVSPVFALLKERELFTADPIALVKSGFLRVKNESGDLVSFAPRKSQMKILDIIQARRKELRPVKIVLLKARQIGFSTLFEAILFAFTTQRPYWSSLILSHEKEHANYLLKMCQLYYDKLDEEQNHLCPRKKHSTEFKFEFAQKKSIMSIATAKNMQAGRGTTIRTLHASECAFYPNFEELMKGLLQSVPEKPDSMVFLETTANGTNQFYKFWNHVQAQFRKGATEWIPIFIGWHEFDEYVRAFSSPKAREIFDKSLSRDERAMLNDYHLSLEQLHWRRIKVETDFFGDESKFKTEYPICPEEAFQSTSKQVFPLSLLKAQEPHVEEPKFKGEIDWDGKKSFLIPNDRGDLKIWEQYKPEHRYVIAADCGQSATTHDPSCAIVLDRTTWRQVAIYHANVDPDEFAKTLFALGAHYRWPVVAPELNGPGVAVVSYLRDLFYPNIYRRTKMQITDNGSFVETEELGWQTNVKTKPIIVQGMVEALRNVLVILHDRDTLDELLTYVVKEIREEGFIKYGAEEGAYDDRVMALLIAVHLAKSIPDHALVERSEQSPFHITRSTGYG